MYLCFRSPKQRYILSYVSRPHFPAQRKGGGISTRGNPGSPLWLRAGGTHRRDYRLKKTQTLSSTIILTTLIYPSSKK